MKSSKLGAVIAVFALAMASASCSSEAKGGGGSGNGPILIGAVYPETGVTSVPEWGKGVKAAEAYINDTLGGVNGRPIKVIYCDDQNQDPSKSAACTRNFVSRKVTTVLEYGGAYGSGGYPVADAAGIASITPGSSLVEQQGDTYIGLTADQTAGFGAELTYAKEQGAKTVGIMVINIPTIVAGIEASIKAAAEKAGLKHVATVPEAGDAADFTPALLKAAKDADVVTMSFGPATMAQIMKAAAANGVHVQFAVSNTGINIPQLVKPAGAAAEGMLAYQGVLNFEDESNPDVKTYRDAMTKSRAADAIGGVSELGFSYLMTAYGVMKEIPDYKASTFLDYFKSNPVPVFLGQTYDASNVPFPDRKAIHVTATRLLQLKDGKFVDVGGDWIDAYKK